MMQALVHCPCTHVAVLQSIAIKRLSRQFYGETLVENHFLLTCDVTHVNNSIVADTV